MFQKTWVRGAATLATFFFIFLTGFLAGKVMTAVPEAPDYRHFVFYKKDGHVYGGVAIPHALLTGDFPKDCENARKQLSSQQKWVYVLCGPVPGADTHIGFLFRAVAADEDQIAAGQ